MIKIQSSVKRMHKINWIVLLFMFPLMGRSADFYVCDCEINSDTNCLAGNDSNDGGLNHPFQSLTKANQTFNTMSAGDLVRFCKGGAWLTSTNLRWVNALCQQDNMCLISDYTPLWASGDEQKPLLTFQNGVSGFNFADSGNAEHEEGYLIENLDLTGSHNGSGVAIANDVDDVLLNNLSITNFRFGVNLGSSNDCNPADATCDAKNDRITLKDSTIQFNDIQGWLGSANDVKILNNYFSDNGSRATFDHNIYISAPSHEVTNGIVISGNELHRNNFNEEGFCSSVSLVVHGQHNNMVIKNNTIWEDVGTVLSGCWGIGIDGGHSEPESFTNILIQSNSIINMGRVAIGLGSCDNCIVENNTLVNNQDLSSRAILAPDRTLATGDLPLNNITVRNNSIYINNSFGSTGITVGGTGNNHSIVSNAIHYTGNSNAFNCLDVDLPVASYLDIDNNLCYTPNTQNAEWANNFGSLSQWQLNSGFSNHSSETNPDFFDPINHLLWAANQDSAMVNAGHLTLSSPLDYNNIQRDS
ncbi:MAG TPA: right-handed parallel beta-helix repeat-containing protein, partial [Oceanospirillales bacterium]|nr:right-handed parallel beta-helix repeat-containing protein [Oceanospirillales bacterium]